MSEDSLILLLTFNRDRDGKIFTYEDSAQLIRNAASVPVYGVWDFLLGYGIVGGRLTSGTSQGDLAATLALCVLRGDCAQNISVIKNNSNLYMFDMMEMKRFGINQPSLPVDSVIINQPLHDRSRLAGMNLSYLDMSGAHLNRSEFQGSDLRGTNLSRSFLDMAFMPGVMLAGADLRGAQLIQADLQGSDLSHADFRGAFMPSCNLLSVNLTGANLRDAYLPIVYLVGSNLNGADLSNAIS